MSSGSLVVNVFNGRRESFTGGPRLLITAMDPRRERLRRRFVDSGSTRFDELRVLEESAGGYTVLVAAKDHADAGFNPIRVTAGQTVVDLMMLRRDADYQFEDFSVIARNPELHALLGGDDGRALYERLRASDKPALACLLNIATAIEQVTLPKTDGVEHGPTLRLFKALERPPAQDRVFMWADAGLLTLVKSAARPAPGFSRFTAAPKGLHEGATDSVKQVDFGEGNLQFSFHGNRLETIGGTPCMLVEADIDYFQDPLAHTFFEVFPNKLKASLHGKGDSRALTDPRTVYGLRWIAGRRLKREFAPPYTLH